MLRGYFAHPRSGIWRRIAASETGGLTSLMESTSARYRFGQSVWGSACDLTRAVAKKPYPRM